MLQFTCIKSTRNERSKLKTRIMTSKGISHIAQQFVTRLNPHITCQMLKVFSLLSL